MAIKIIVFDFDGTLVASNQLKYEAFFKLFPDDERHTQMVNDILAEIGEASRYKIIARILKRFNRRQSDLKSNVNTLADRYNDIVLDGAKKCPEIPGAGRAIASLAEQYKLYVSSTTPDKPLKEIVRFRGWSTYFEDIFGYPHQKSRTLRQIMDREKASSSQVLVVGDGESDRSAAEENSCSFLQVTEGFSFNHIQKTIENIR